MRNNGQDNTTGPRQAAAHLRQVLADIELDLQAGPKPRVTHYDRGNRANESEEYYAWRRDMFFRTKICFRDYVLRALNYYESLIIT